MSIPKIELQLTRKLGDIGKKVHSGRSRNDQVLVDIKLYAREQIKAIVESTKTLFDTLISLSEKYKDYLLPGYRIYNWQCLHPLDCGLELMPKVWLTI